MSRKVAIRELKSAQPVAIGAGITERYYFQHIKNIRGYRLKITPRFFGSDTAYDLEKLIEDVRAGGGFAICVYDKDVTQWNESQRVQIQKLEAKFHCNSNVVLCGSLPSIEYWFLMHFRDSSRLYRTSEEVIRDLRAHLPNYAKTTSYLEKPDWVRDMIANGRLEQAVAMSKKTVEEGHPYSQLGNAIEYLERRKQKGFGTRGAERGCY